jgi:DNA-directed RNA polymerase specialized sigma24 family protein
MSSDGSVTRWIGLLQAGDAAAAQALWEHYFRRLVGLARKRLRGAPRRAADEEDVALSAFDSFCRAAEQGRFPRLNDRDDLWRLLMIITGRKAAHLVRDQRRLKRGGAAVATDDEYLLDHMLGREPSPELAAEVADQSRHLLGLLDEPDLKAVALARLEGYTVEEIAAQLGYADRSVKRKLQLIRSIWEGEVTP